MTRWIRRAVPSLAVTALCAAVAWPAAAQPAAAPFPAGKTVTISVGVAPGGTNDMLMRMVAHYIGKYLPGNPKVVARNMPGAGGRNLAAYLYAQAPRNGTEFAALQRAITTDRLIGDPNLPFNPVEFTWLGSPSRTTDICLAWHATTFHTLDDLRAREFIIAASGSSERNIFILQQLTDFKIRSIIGYPGGSEQNLALERGEVHGRCSLAWESLKSSYADWVKEKKVRVLLQFAFSTHPDLVGVPLISDLATNDTDRQALEILMAAGNAGYPFAGPPGLLPEVRDMLRDAYAKTLADPALIDEAKRVKFDLNPISGAEIQRVVERVHAATPQAIERAKQLGTSPKQQ